MPRKGDNEELAKQAGDGASETLRETFDKMDTIATEVTNLPARVQLYRQIIGCMKESLANYYAKYPERATDERGKDNEDKAVRDIATILRILDRYEIGYKEVNSNPSETGGKK